MVNLVLNLDHFLAIFVLLLPECPILPKITNQVLESDDTTLKLEIF